MDVHPTKHTHDGSGPRCCYINGVPWIPSIYPLYVSIYIYIYQHHGFYGIWRLDLTAQKCCSSGMISSLNSLVHHNLWWHGNDVMKKIAQTGWFMGISIGVHVIEIDDMRMLMGGGWGQLRHPVSSSRHTNWLHNDSQRWFFFLTQAPKYAN